MHRYVRFALALLFSAAAMAQPASAPRADDFSGHPRAVILSDIGNEPDDQMSLVRLLLYSNEIEIEALIASTSTWQKKAVHPEMMRAVIAAYGRVRDNLLLHAQGWPAATDLDARVFTGQTGYGMAAGRSGPHIRRSARDRPGRDARRSPPVVDICLGRR
jgi:hypothetical protein